MSSLSRITVDLEIGQRILIGKDRKPAEITKIEYFEKTGELHINTTAGKRRVFTFALDNG